MIENGIGQFAALKNRNGGRTRKLDDFRGLLRRGLLRRESFRREWFRDLLRIPVWAWRLRLASFGEVCRPVRSRFFLGGEYGV